MFDQNVYFSDISSSNLLSRPEFKSEIHLMWRQFLKLGKIYNQLKTEFKWNKQTVSQFKLNIQPVQCFQDNYYVFVFKLCESKC